MIPKQLSPLEAFEQAKEEYELDSFYDRRRRQITYADFEMMLQPNQERSMNMFFMTRAWDFMFTRAFIGDS